ncbi:MAG: dTMP kinase [Desulfuromonas sp.]|nr:MAG: dTMP kinase [Desulfuromonas sp.]
MSRFITFEGTEGCGKSTQLRLLADHLSRQGLQVCVTREPGGCPISDAIRQILLDPSSAGMDSKTELFLYAAARAQHLADVVRPALERGEVVLCDRFSDATVAYQGYGRGLDIEQIEHLNREATDGLVPDLTLLLDLPLETGLARAISRNSDSSEDEGRFEQEALAFHQRVRDGYLTLARSHDRFRVVPADGDIDEVATRIRHAVAPWLGVTA